MGSMRLPVALQRQLETTIQTIGSPLKVLLEGFRSLPCPPGGCMGRYANARSGGGASFSTASLVAMRRGGRHDLDVQ